MYSRQVVSPPASSSTHLDVPPYTGGGSAGLSHIGLTGSLKMGEAEAGFHQWYREPGQICFRNETGKDPLFCGQEEDCYIGMALPFINESTWDWRVRAVLYLVGLLYRSVLQRLD